MTFSLWLSTLMQDAFQNGVSLLRFAESWGIWHRVYADGVQPTVASVIAWCLEDPERFIDLRETESISMVRKPPLAAISVAA